MDSQVFGTTYASAYDSLYAAKDYEGEVELIKSALARSGHTAAGGSILDLGCGTGGHSLRLARDGFAVAGVDFSPGMLAVARGKAANDQFGRTGNATFLEGDVGEIDVGRQFDAAIMMFAVLGYQLSNATVLKVLGNIRRHLKPGALFIADFWYGPAVLTQRPGETVRVLGSEPSQTIRTSRTELDIPSHTALVEFNLWRIKDGRVSSSVNEKHRMRYFFPLELELLLETSGFSMISLTAFPHIDRPLSDQTWNALLVARAEQPTAGR